MDEVGSNPSALAKKAGLNHTAVRDILSGKSKSPRADTLDKLAAALGTSTAKLLGERTSLPSNTRIMRMVGNVQAGVWQEAFELPYDDQEPVAVPVGGLPMTDRMYLLKVKGDSMNLAQMPEGTMLICLDFHDFLNLRDVQTGDMVIAHREGAAGIEATVKQLEIRKDGSHWLWPRSDNPEHQTPIRVPPASEWEEGHGEVQVRAVVAAVLTQLL